MKTTARLALIALALFAASCQTAGGPTRPETPQAPQIMQPGSPGQDTRTVSARQASDLSKVSFTEADVKFMQGMIGHHTQAIEMVDLLKTRSDSDGMKKLALRIEVSQEDEIKMMQEWLQNRGQALPDPHAHHKGLLMPGMLTADEMARLGSAKGVGFDRLFLEGMIKHHGGALTMVQELFASPGAGQESDIFAFASDVDADQRMEIERMAAMLNALNKEQE